MASAKKPSANADKPSIDFDDVPAFIPKLEVPNKAGTKNTATVATVATSVKNVKAKNVKAKNVKAEAPKRTTLTTCDTQTRDDDDVVAGLLQAFKEKMQVVQDKLKTNLGSVGKRNRKKKKQFYKLAEAEEETLKQTLEKDLELLGLNLADVLPGKGKGAEAAAATAPKKKSKSQRRREKKRAEEKRRAQQIKEAMRLAKSTESPKDIENKKLADKIAPLGLRIHEVQADGHCLFRALAHFLVTENGGRVIVTYQQLRQKAAAHMRRFSENFSPFFAVSSLPAGLDAKPKTFAEYLVALEDTALWGGELELRALSMVFTRPIEVFKADGANLQMCRDKFPLAKPLRISFHHHYYALGEHYNSVVPR